MLVSRTVVDLVAGSRLHFSDRGAYGVAGDSHKWHLFAVAPAPGADGGVIPASPSAGAARELAHVG